MTTALYNDTIAAVSTAPGGALGIVRISGPAAAETAEKVCRISGKSLSQTPRKMRLGHLLSDDGETCLAVFMPGPASYTGEDVAEIQCHGGDIAPQRLLHAILANGVRMAEPGEFTRRAFINGKMDLTQAEAVLDLINARTAAAARLAEKQLSGNLGATVTAAAGDLPSVLAEIESRLDFSEEDLDWCPPELLIAGIQTSVAKLKDLLRGSRAGAIIRNGVRLVIGGTPNVGKSSLLNRILGYDRAIVTDIPGTTRDTLEECAVIRGIQFNLTDTAGIRKGDLDPVETVGIERSRDSLRRAEVILWLLDPTAPLQPQMDELRSMQDAAGEHVSSILCWNKADLCRPEQKNTDDICISVQTGEGLEQLFDAIEAAVHRGMPDRESDVAVAERHAALIAEAVEQLESACHEVGNEDWELAAVGIRAAIRCLGTITGTNVSVDVLDEIFARFCIGK